MPKWNLPVDPEELQFALQLGNAAGTYQMPIENPETKGIDLFDEESGEIQEIRFQIPVSDPASKGFILHGPWRQCRQQSPVSPNPHWGCIFSYLSQMVGIFFSFAFDSICCTAGSVDKF